jgi:beta-glucosidase
VSGDDGYRLWVNDQRVINNWQQQSETLTSYAMRLEAGKAYPIRLEYYEQGGGAIIRFGVISAEDAVGRVTKPLAAKADAAVVCVGFDPNSETEGADRTFQLPGGQDALIRQISSVNKNTIVVITAGGSVDMTRWIDGVPAIFQAWYPGQEGGTALAQLLFGDFSPSGKLPASFERRWEDNATFNSYHPQEGAKGVSYKEGVFLGYRHFDRSDVKPLFAFGHGLSYTSFRYSNLSISPTADGASVSFEVRNTGKRAGAEVAQVYVGDKHASIPRPIKELKGVSKVNLKAGESRKVSLTLDRRAFSYYDEKGKQWKAEPGEFEFLVGGSSDKIELKGSFRLER